MTKFLLALTVAASPISFADEPIKLFNGKDLAGWHVDVPKADKNKSIAPSFIVRDGRLVSLGTPRGHLITDKSYENYRLEVEYRFVGKPGNCGVLVHSSTPRALYKMFPASIEVQMHHQNAGDFWCITENIEVPNMKERRPHKEGQKFGGQNGDARRILNLTDDSEKPVGEWNKMKIECLGDEVKVWVNGDLVNHGTKCTVSKGQIALQAEGSEVEFKGLLLTPLKKK
ncbi:MAG: 3-keto-disaccharide hydrolase [Akkermansiaceae bacterium]